MSGAVVRAKRGRFNVSVANGNRLFERSEEDTSVASASVASGRCEKFNDAIEKGCMICYLCYYIGVGKS